MFAQGPRGEIGANGPAGFPGEEVIIFSTAVELSESR